MLAFDGGVVLPDGTCAVGVGACARQGTFTCGGGALGCSATPGDAGTETCNGLDDNCDGTVAEGLTQRCFPDEDNDRYATSSVASQLCPVSTRPTFGNCPAAFVAPGSSLGVDCAPADAGAYRTESTLADRDGDRRCVGAPVSSCIGAAAPQGQTLAANCLGTDCDDTNPALLQLFSVRADQDGDGYCVGAVSSQCAGAAPASGSRLAAACNATTDCKDNNPLANQTCFIDGSTFQGYRTDRGGSGSLECSPFQSLTSDDDVITITSCPSGFTVINLRAVAIFGPVTCQLLGPNRVRTFCPQSIYSPAGCIIVGDCQAN